MELKLVGAKSGNTTLIKLMELSVTHSKKSPTTSVGSEKRAVGAERVKKKHFINLMTIRKWHWMSSAICFISMLLFSVTGITLNHADIIENKPATVRIAGQFPEELLPQLVVKSEQKSIELPVGIHDWLKQHKSINISATTAEVNGAEIYLPLARPGGDAWLSIDTETGEFEYESTDRGWISYFNDIHKGRNTGKAWIYFMDIFAVACIIFSVTGFLLLQRYADTRSQTWPLLIAGLVLPIFFMLFLIHK